MNKQRWFAEPMAGQALCPMDVRRGERPFDPPGNWK